MVTKENITLVRKSLSQTKEYVFKINAIKYFGFANQQYTKHPMDNPVIDFTGLAAQEKELQYIIDEGNIKIETDTKNIKFGKNIPSWEVEEIIEEIELFTGRKFSKPISENSSVDLFTDVDTETDIEIEQEILPQTNAKQYAYMCDKGELIIEQRNEIPSSEDIAYLNGNLAPTGKYKIGENKFVLVSNGLIYAVRGFGNQQM